MRITGVRTVLYEYPLRRPVGDVQAHGMRRMAELAVFLETDDEPVGVAIAAAGASAAVHALAAELVGRDPRAVRAHLRADAADRVQGRAVRSHRARHRRPGLRPVGPARQGERRALVA